MKKNIFLAVTALFFAGAGFSQSVEAKPAAAAPHTEKPALHPAHAKDGKAACCAGSAEGKSCQGHASKSADASVNSSNHNCEAHSHEQKAKGKDKAVAPKAQPSPAAK